MSQHAIKSLYRPENSTMLFDIFCTSRGPFLWALFGWTYAERALIRLCLLLGVCGLRCYTCENAKDNEECNKNGPIDCEPTMDTCQTIVSYSGNIQSCILTQCVRVLQWRKNHWRRGSWRQGCNPQPKKISRKIFSCLLTTWHRLLDLPVHRQSPIQVVTSW